MLTRLPTPPPPEAYCVVWALGTELLLGRTSSRASSNRAMRRSASLGSADYSQVDVMGLRGITLYFGAKTSSVSPNWCDHID